jgi:hypothetical protein
MVAPAPLCNPAADSGTGDGEAAARCRPPRRAVSLGHLNRMGSRTVSRGVFFFGAK